MNGTGRPDPCPTPTNSANALRGRRTQRRKRAYNRKNLEYGKTRQRKKTMKMQDLYYNHPERIPGAHLITMDLPRGA